VLPTSHARTKHRTVCSRLACGRGGKTISLPGSKDAEFPLETEPRVQTVDRRGRTTGSAGKLEVHQVPARLHRAVSVFALDSSGRLIIQRRSASKYHSAGLWGNTCCGHPLPSETARDCAERRLRDEVGLTGADLQAAGAIIYQSSDSVSGLTEYEYDHLFVGRSSKDPNPNPDEISELGRLDLETSLADVARLSDAAGWFVPTLRAALPALLALRAQS